LEANSSYPRIEPGSLCPAREHGRELDQSRTSLKANISYPRIELLLRGSNRSARRGEGRGRRLPNDEMRRVGERDRDAAVGERDKDAGAEAERDGE
jgi:hypothetical protein